METPNEYNQELQRSHSATDGHDAIDKKLDELIVLLTKHNLDIKTLEKYRAKIDNALTDNTRTTFDDLKAFEIIDERKDASREQLLDEFSILLETHTFNSKAATQYLRIERSNKIVMMLIGVTMIVMGFAMIVMPAPPYFEMFTIFYFSRDNGVTLMDLISLIIVFAGVYVLVRSLYKKHPTAK